MSLWSDIADLSSDIIESIGLAEKEQGELGETPVDAPVEPCPFADSNTLTLIPRKPQNILDTDKLLKTLLPDRYPTADLPLKEIEYNFYPDLNQTRTITAVLTETAWHAQCDIRPTPKAGVTVYFYLGPGNTADVTLYASPAITDSEGCASIQVTSNTLHTTKDAIEQANCIEIHASLTPACDPNDPKLTLTIHRNEDVDHALGANENPDQFVATLRPALEMQTWIVRQQSLWVTSNGAKAVQQLLNQVACRQNGGGHTFLRPDGQFGNGSQNESACFIQNFSTQQPANTAATTAYAQRQFGVQVEENEAGTQGVKTYIRSEYNQYSEGDVVDAHLLVGLEAWQPGRDANIMDADGLLDIYRAVVWEFIERMRDRAGEYVIGARPNQTPRIWYRHPSDTGGAHNWPATVVEGESYWYGGARSLDEFHADLANNRVNTIANEDEHWVHYLRQNNSRIGLHGGNIQNRVDVPLLSYTTHAHLNTDQAIVNIGNQANPRYQLRHIHGTHNGQYTGIDCSVFCQRLALEPRFRAEHCADLAGEKICVRIPEITHSANTGWVTSRLTTRRWPPYYRAIPSATWRRDVAYRGDVLNVPGSHIVTIETNNRQHLSNRQANQLWIWHANGVTTVSANAAAAGWNPTACVRRVVHSPMAQFSAAWQSWGHANANVQYGRIHLWE